MNRLPPYRATTTRHRRYLYWSFDVQAIHRPVINYDTEHHIPRWVSLSWTTAWRNDVWSIELRVPEHDVITVKLWFLEEVYSPVLIAVCNVLHKLRRLTKNW